METLFGTGDALSSVRNCKTLDLTFRALLTGGVARVTVERGAGFRPEVVRL
jgi:hypothetical protein